ncbi:GNAT family N-acetyltransferase [Mesorhizobium sp. RMAD-H1]|uniref:GNAT family N-acetyltransferase n=1 Tax=Mesorhizobium sp. RMAD-H1 TaxID=2587065 RepID=UPI0016227B37|nr:GNAT family N-acetyltransferase [Mesorhizobium sp. RMAD-H1]MBB2970489.1 CelD/BcsL family acetyltransferase involved in cellulose biosynthesis [Mesorhizobium sp. RMAD-H1]
MIESLSPRILGDISAALSLWDEMPDHVSGLPQSVAWVRNWHEHANADCFIAALYEAETPVLLLPLEMVKSGAIRLARFPGGTHANCNFPVLARGAAGGIGPSAVRALARAIHAARPDIDVLLLPRQVGRLDGITNPLLHLDKTLNPNPVLSASLSCGFDAVLERSNAKRKRKKHRQHARRYEEAGGYRILTASSADEATQMLDRFFAMKAERFARTGITDVFADAGVRAFFRSLFGEAAGKKPASFELKALEVAGILRAVIGKSYWLDDLTVEFGGIAEDDLVSASPGEFLFFEDIMQACRDGIAIYSFGIGDEPYKRDWCDRVEPLYDSMAGFTLTGRAHVAAYRARNAAAAAIKNNAQLWTAAKKLRGLLGGRHRS